MPLSQIVLGIALIVFSLLIILVVLLQEGHQGNVKAIQGSHVTDTFYTKHRGRSIDAFLERWTKAISITFFLLVVATNAVLFFFSKG